LIERVRDLPGVQSATLANRPPSLNSMSFGGVTVPGVTPPEGQFFYLSWTLIDSGYFTTLRVPLIAGRDFEATDRSGSERVAIVGEAVAQRLWPGRDAVGQFLLVHGGNPATPDAPPPAQLRVVGVARDLTAGGRRRSAAPLALYVPWPQRYSSQLTVMARSEPERSLAGDLRALITSMDPNLPVLAAQTLESQQNGPADTQMRIAASVAGSVGFIGLLLAAIGIYGVTAYAVTQKTREIGVRVSLGADRAAVVALVLRQGMLLVAVGSAIGLALGAGAGRLLSGAYGIPAPDAPMLAGAVVLFATVGSIACFVPVRRAMRIDAMDALRYE
jgi:hypothetical protein